MVSVPSPKSQYQVLMVPPLALLKSVNVIGNPEHPGELLLKAATGPGITVTGFTFTLVQPAVSVMVKVTVYVPAAA